MNCRIRSEKNGFIVTTYFGLDNFIVKVSKSETDKTKPSKIDSCIASTWIEAVNKHREYCGSYLLPSELEKNTK